MGIRDATLGEAARLMEGNEEAKRDVMQIMSSKRFKDLVALALKEGYTAEEKAAGLAALAAMILYDDPKRQAKYVKLYFFDPEKQRAPEDHEPW